MLPASATAPSGLRAHHLPKAGRSSSNANTIPIVPKCGTCFGPEEESGFPSELPSLLLVVWVGEVSAIKINYASGERAMQSTNSAKNFERCPVLGVPMAVVDYDQAVALTNSWTEEHAVYAVAAANTHVVSLARHDRGFGATLSQFDMIVPDGMPLLWAMNRRGAGLRDRVYGPTLMLHALKQPGIPHFLLGGSELLLENLTAKLRERFPGIVIAGSYSPPFGEWSEEENQRIFQKIADSGAKYIWVGLGCPKQERWIARNKSSLPPGVYFAIGAAFAFHAGMVSQAPAWMQRRGLEWVYRLIAEPGRLWKRYLVYNTLFLWYLIWDCFRNDQEIRKRRKVTEKARQGAHSGGGV